MSAALLRCETERLSILLAGFLQSMVVDMQNEANFSKSAQWLAKL
jgi:hypothetical protein